MSSKAEQAHAAEQVQNSVEKRTVKSTGTAKSELIRKGHEQSAKGRALHARTKRRADVLAGKPDEGPVPAFWKTGVNGGEAQTVNGVAVGRGADGAAKIAKASRKSTRGEVPGGEKASQMAREVTRRVHAPSARADRSMRKAKP